MYKTLSVAAPRPMLRIAAGLCICIVLRHISLAQTVKQVFAFSNSHSSPTPASVTPVQGRDGNLYGTTSGLGVVQSNGTVFKATTTGKETSLHIFAGTDGAFPLAGLTLGTDGNFYGAAGSGEFDFGLIFRISPTGTYTILHAFSGGADGAFPVEPPIQGWDGNFYGTTGAGTGNAGTVYKFTRSGTFSTIFSFNSDNSQGTQLSAPLLQASDGNLYGVANIGGAANCGTIFKVSRSGVLLSEYSFPCDAGGYAPVGSLIEASDGNFYGVTELGGTGTECGFSSGCGTVFRMNKKGQVSILHDFVGSKEDGALPTGLTEGTDGNFYGSTGKGGTANGGTLFQITKSGTFALLYSFTGPNGQTPGAALYQDTNGEIYGTTEQGGTYGEGTLFSLDMGLSPFLSFVVPAGRIGGQVQILGQGFIGATSVTFNGVPATSFKVVSDTYLTAVVPSGATSGKVVVTTPGGVLTSNVSFRIIQ